MKEYITPETTIAEAVKKHPVTADIMMSHGLHCVGCHVSGIESIRQGAMGHGRMDEEDVQELIKEMNNAIHEREKAKNTGRPLHITPKAAEKIKEFAKKEKGETTFLRVTVMPGGCAGLRYALDFDEQTKKDDLITDAEGYPVRIDPRSAELLKGAVLDYLEGLGGAGFKFDNPNAQSVCGCGDSFS